MGGACSVRVVPLPLVAELRDRSVLAVRNEDRVEAEAFRSADRVCDPASERARSPMLGAVGCDGYELAYVARAAAVALDAFELLEGALRLPPCRPPGGHDSRSAFEPVDLDARVFAEHPAVAGARAPELRFRARVLVVRVAG